MSFLFQMMMSPPKPKGLSEKEMTVYKQNIIDQIAKGKENQTQTVGSLKNVFSTYKMAVEQVKTQMTKEQFNDLFKEAKNTMKTNGYSSVYSSLLPKEFKLA